MSLSGSTYFLTGLLKSVFKVMFSLATVTAKTPANTVAVLAMTLARNHIRWVNQGAKASSVTITCDFSERHCFELRPCKFILRLNILFCLDDHDGF
jgi:hypothetical protein